MNLPQFSVKLTAIALSGTLLSPHLLAESFEQSGINKSTDQARKVNLGRSVVTATGYEQDIKDAPASISIITNQDISTRPIRDLGDAVQDTPGVYVEQDKTGQNTISMRGLGSAYTLILIDGKRQNTARGFIQNGLGNQTSFMPPISTIEKIEVIRGPASTIYGSDAMGGVINIITKKHTDTFQAGVQLESRFFELSEWGNAYGGNAYMNIPLLKDKLSLNLRGSARLNEQNGFLKPIPSSNGNPYAAHSSTGSTNYNAGFRLNYSPTAQDYIYLDSEIYNGRLGTLNTSSKSITAVNELYKSNNILSHDGNYNWGKLSSYAQYSYNIIAPHRSRKTNDGSLPIGASKGDYINWAEKRINQNVALQSVYTNDFDFKDRGVLIFNGGLYYLYENLAGTFSKKRRDLHQNQASAFAEGEYLINESISTTLGLRYNYSDRYTSVPNPRFYVNFNPTDYLTFKAGVASGILIPSLLQTIDDFAESTSGTQTLYTYGNPNLKPEQSWNYELSAIFDFESTMLVLTGYYTDFNNQIETLSSIAQNTYMPEIGKTCNTSSCAYYRNVSKSLVTGTEASLKLKPIYGFSLDANYSFTYTEALSGDYKGEPINSIPRHSFTFVPKYQIGSFDMYIRWNGKFKTPTPASGANSRTDVRKVVGHYYKDYQLVDVAFNYKINQNYSLTLAVNNLFDVYFIDYAQANSSTTSNSLQNRYQRILPSRNFWISFKADW